MIARCSHSMGGRLRRMRSSRYCISAGHQGSNSVIVEMTAALQDGEPVAVKNH